MEKECKKYHQNGGCLYHRKSWEYIAAARWWGEGIQQGASKYDRVRLPSKQVVFKPSWAWIQSVEGERLAMENE